MIVMKCQCAEFQIPVGLGNTGLEFKPSNDSINHNLFVFQTFTFLLAWHFPHRYVVLV